MNTNKLYYYSLPGGEKMGPCEAQEIVGKVTSGQLSPKTLVWTEGMTSWESVSILMGGVSIASFDSWGPINAFTSCMKRYACFTGRASRSEFWFFELAIFVLMILMSLVDSVIGTAPVLYMLSGLAIFLPALAVSVRRLHDIGKSGLWLFISFVPFIGSIWLLVLLCTGSDSENEYGSAPEGPVA